MVRHRDGQGLVEPLAVQQVQETVRRDAKETDEGREEYAVDWQGHVQDLGEEPEDKRDEYQRPDVHPEERTQHPGSFKVDPFLGQEHGGRCPRRQGLELHTSSRRDGTRRES